MSVVINSFARCKDMKLYKFLLLLALIAGCAGNQPRYIKSYNIDALMPTSINYKLVESTLHQTFPSNRIDRNCVIYTSPEDEKIEYASMCYKVNNNKILAVSTLLKDNSTTRQWLNKIIDEQYLFEQNYNANLNNRFAAADADQDACRSKADSIKINLIDDTSMLPDNIFNKFSDMISLYCSPPSVRIRYANYTSEYYFVDGYRIHVKDDLDKNNDYHSISNQINVHITSYKVIPIPPIYEIEDQNIKLQAVYTSGSLAMIELSNLTNDYIQVDAISGYYDGKIANNILKKGIVLPPQSVTSAAYPLHLEKFPLQNSSNQYVDSGQEVNYGYSVRYKLSGSGNTSTLYKVKNIVAK